MNNQGKIHRQIIATGNEWKPCVECKRKCEPGEILTAVDTESNAGVLSWFCEDCTEQFFAHLLARSWRTTWKLRHGDGGMESVDLDAASYNDAG